MNRLLQHWVTDQAMQRPDSVAVSREDVHVNYEELETRSNRLAHILKELGCKRGDRVGLLMPKVPEAVVCMAGILKADGIYVPLDPESPAKRLAKIVAKCRPRCILAAGEVGDLLTKLLAEIGPEEAPWIGWMESRQTLNKRAVHEKVNPEFILDNLEDTLSTPLKYQNSPNNPAHILFTSGSTGEPKGVVTSHANDLAFIRWAKNYFGIQPGDHLSSHPPLHFDMSSLDIYGALSTGAQLHMIPREYNVIPHKIADFIRDCEITQWFSVPSVLNYMAKFDVVNEGDFPSLKRLIWCGEVFPVPALRYWMERLPDVSFTNLYGPTETTVASSYYTVPKIPESDSAEIPIGKACAGESLYILDDQLNPVPDGTIGNLFISGVGVSQGYWDDRERTDEVFVFNPYALEGDRTFYKTGDLARFDEDGLCYFHGRKDNQIKSRGYRIELGEIEKAINSLDMTVECAVVAVSSEGFEGQLICCAYVPDKTLNETVTSASLKQKLDDLLPDYMIPRQWECYATLPKNQNGKVDRNKLQNRFLNHEYATNAE